jgi:hypothetical protein
VSRIELGIKEMKTSMTIRIHYLGTANSTRPRSIRRIRMIRAIRDKHEP